MTAGPSTVTFNLTGVNGENLAGVYTSPYYGNVNGSTTIPVICDDFSDNSYIPESWSAYQTTLTQVIAAPSQLSYLKWNGANSKGVVVPTYAAWNLNQSQAYTTAAILMLDILNYNSIVNPSQAQVTAQEDYSYALWELFDPTAAAGAVGTGNANWSLSSGSDAVVPWLSGSYASDLTAATQDLETAISTSASVLDGYGVTIYSYVGPPTGSTPTCNNSPCPSAPPQEFITVSSSPGTTYGNPNTPVPEPSELVVLGSYILFGACSVVFFGRRRIFRA